MNAGSAKVNYKIGWVLDLVANTNISHHKNGKNIRKSNDIIAGNGIPKKQRVLHTSQCFPTF